MNYAEKNLFISNAVFCAFKVCTSSEPMFLSVSMCVCFNFRSGQSSCFKLGSNSELACVCLLAVEIAHASQLSHKAVCFK